jgi:hypothetical protein
MILSELGGHFQHQDTSEELKITLFHSLSSHLYLWDSNNTSLSGYYYTWLQKDQIDWGCQLCKMPTQGQMAVSSLNEGIMSLDLVGPLSDV